MVNHVAMGTVLTRSSPTPVRWVSRHLAWHARSMAQNPWQSVIHTHLIGSGHVECAAVLRKKDGAVKATSVGYQVHGTLWTVLLQLLLSLSPS